MRTHPPHMRCVLQPRARFLMTDFFILHFVTLNVVQAGLLCTNDVQVQENDMKHLS